MAGTILSVPTVVSELSERQHEGPFLANSLRPAALVEAPPPPAGVATENQAFKRVSTTHVPIVDFVFHVAANRFPMADGDGRPKQGDGRMFIVVEAPDTRADVQD